MKIVSVGTQVAVLAMLVVSSFAGAQDLGGQSDPFDRVVAPTVVNPFSNNGIGVEGNSAKTSIIANSPFDQIIGILNGDSPAFPVAAWSGALPNDLRGAFFDRFTDILTGKVDLFGQNLGKVGQGDAGVVYGIQVEYSGYTIHASNVTIIGGSGGTSLSFDVNRYGQSDETISSSYSVSWGDVQQPSTSVP